AVPGVGRLEEVARAHPGHGVAQRTGRDPATAVAAQGHINRAMVGGVHLDRGDETGGEPAAPGEVPAVAGADPGRLAAAYVGGDPVVEGQAPREDVAVTAIADIHRLVEDVDGRRDVVGLAGLRGAKAEHGDRLAAAVDADGLLDPGAALDDVSPPG